jgi:hypothetical protein
MKSKTQAALRMGGAFLSLLGRIRMTRPVHFGGVRTVQEQQRINRRLDRQLRSASVALRRMQHGDRLHLHFDVKRGAVWALSPSGKKISAEVAKIVIADFHVTSVGDALFRNASAQTYRWVD